MLDSSNSCASVATVLLSSPAVFIIMIQGVVGLIAMCLTFATVGLQRLSVARRLHASRVAGTNSAVAPNAVWPPIAIVLPCKGVRTASQDNWRSQLSTHYRGPVEFLFSVESESDPAVEAIRAVLAEPCHCSVDAQIVIAGRSWHNGQKLHNQLAAAAASSQQCKYILFMDDDVQLHATAIGSLVAELENDPTLLVSTGYTFEIPALSAPSISKSGLALPAAVAKPPLIHYVLTVYRALNMGGFGTTRPSFVWGGCMMLPRAVLFENRHQLTSILIDGAYSDDMTVGNVGRVALSKALGHPFDTILYSPHAAATNWRDSYIGFIRRQFFTLRTSFGRADAKINLSSMFQLIYSGALFGIPQIVCLAVLLSCIGHVITAAVSAPAALATPVEALKVFRRTLSDFADDVLLSTPTSVRCTYLVVLYLVLLCAVVFSLKLLAYCIWRMCKETHGTVYHTPTVEENVL
jgi:hypothetical protein